MARVFGGDEFSVLMLDATAEAVEALASRIHEELGHIGCRAGVRGSASAAAWRVPGRIPGWSREPRTRLSMKPSIEAGRRR